MPEMGGMPSNDELVPFFTFEDIDYAIEKRRILLLSTA